MADNYIVTNAFTGEVWTVNTGETISMMLVDQAKKAGGKPVPALRIKRKDGRSLFIYDGKGFVGDEDSKNGTRMLATVRKDTRKETKP